MTGVPVSELGINFSTMAGSGNTAVKNTGTGFRNSFQNAVNLQTSNQQTEKISDMSSASQKKSTDSGKTETVDKKNETDDGVKDDIREDKPVKPDNGKERSVKKDSDDEPEVTENTADEDEIPPETVETVLTAVESVIEQVSETMEVPESDVMDAMENLGMDKTDILDQTKLTDLVANLSGNEDALSILTDENLYQKLETIQDFAAETNTNLMEELDLSQEALSEVLDQTEELIGQPDLAEEIEIPDMPETDQTAEAVQESTADTRTGDLKQPVLNGMKDYKVTVNENGEQVTVSVRTDDTTGNQVAKFEGQGKQEEGASSEGDTAQMKMQAGKDSRIQELAGDQTHAFSQTLNTNIDAEVPQAQTTEETPVASRQAQDIAEQIMEDMRMNLKSDTTELTMNLHPASLGNVRVNLVAANGQVSAQFIAQNETVKSAIESQVVQLTNQLEAQGVKIEAVEVTLASHQFESGQSNSDTGSEHSDRESEKPKAARTRRIDLNAAMEDEEAELDESDRITADMMARNGNTVDYMA